MLALRAASRRLSSSCIAYPKVASRSSSSRSFFTVAATAFAVGFGGIAALDEPTPPPNMNAFEEPYFHNKTCPCEYPHENHPCTCAQDYVPGCHELKVFAGSCNNDLAESIGNILGTGVGAMSLGRFADGEVSVQVSESVRGKDVFVVQGCSGLVNDNMIELLLLISTMRRASAKNVTAVIPYFPYKHHRRGTPLATEHGSRFLHSHAADFARMLETMGVDRVIAVDLQRPGQGHEACFFSSSVPVESLDTTDLGVQYFANFFKEERDRRAIADIAAAAAAAATAAAAAAASPGGGVPVLPALPSVLPASPPPARVVVVSPSTELLRKARKFQIGLRRSMHEVNQVGIASVVSAGQDGQEEIVGNVAGADVVIVDDLIDTGATLCSVVAKLKKKGAARVFAFASHGLFSGNALKVIEQSVLEEVVVLNTVALPVPRSPRERSTKVVQIDVAPLLAGLIKSEHYKHDRRDVA